MENQKKPLIKRITKDDINNRLLHRGIVLTGEYEKTHSKTSFRCSNEHSWLATPGNVLYGTGCPHCSGNIPLTKQIVNERLRDRGIEMLGEYVHQKQKTLFKCHENHTWKAAPGSVLYANGCPTCGKTKLAEIQKSKRLTKDTIFERLSGREIQLIGEYENAHSKTSFMCKSGHTWEAAPGSVMAGNGCPHCSGRFPLTKEKVQHRLAKRKITLVSEYLGTQAKSIFRCEVGHEWKTAAANVIQGTGCPHCDGQIPLSKEIINARISNRGFAMLSDYKNVDTKASFRCKAGHIWETTPYHITRRTNPTGCPYCSNQAPLSTEIVNSRIKERGYLLVDDFITNSIKVRFRCNEGHVWKAKPNNVLNGRGCPDCAPRTTDNDVFYLWIANRQNRIKLKSGEFLIKYGVTSERLENDRIREVAASWKAKASILAMVKTLEPAKNVEQMASQIGKKLSPELSGLDGWTEFRIVDAQELKQLMAIAAELSHYRIVWSDSDEYSMDSIGQTKIGFRQLSLW